MPIKKCLGISLHPTTHSAGQIGVGRSKSGGRLRVKSHRRGGISHTQWPVESCCEKQHAI